MSTLLPSDPKYLCLDCPLPECDDRAPGCIYHQARPHRDMGRGSRWKPLYKQVADLQPGDFMAVPLSMSDLRSAQAGIVAMVRIERLPSVKTWRINLGDDQGILNILRKGGQREI